MDQLVELVSKKAGISQAQARTAVETVVNFMKTKLPDPFGDRLESILEGADSLGLDKGIDLLGGLLGKK